MALHHIILKIECLSYFNHHLLLYYSPCRRALLLCNSTLQRTQLYRSYITVGLHRPNCMICAVKIEKKRCACVRTGGWGLLCTPLQSDSRLLYFTMRHGAGEWAPVWISRWVRDGKIDWHPSTLLLLLSTDNWFLPFLPFLLLEKWTDASTRGAVDVVGCRTWAGSGTARLVFCRD